MSRGRPRKFDKTIPLHIDQKRIPRGAYWDSRDRVWYTIRAGKRSKLEGPKATLADLHIAIEKIETPNAGTVSDVLTHFHESAQFAALSDGTRKNYNGLKRAIVAYPSAYGALGTLPVDEIPTSAMQAMIDKIAKEFPTKANHWARYLARSFAWGIRRGHNKTNPARGLEHADERGKTNMPQPGALVAVVDFARARAALKAHTKGSLSAWLPVAIEIAYLCRLRGIEVLTLTDAHVTKDGLRTNRRKGSRDNVVEWTPRLRAAVDAAVDLRKETVEKLENRKGKQPRAIRPEDRPLVVSQSAKRLQRSSLDSAWARLMDAAIEAGVITPEQRFTPHGLKHRGITDTRGTRPEKQQASGHKSAHMLDVYDHEVPAVKPAGDG